jgi:hypothetical protein
MVKIGIEVHLVWQYVIGKVISIATIMGFITYSSCSLVLASTAVWRFKVYMLLMFLSIAICRNGGSGQGPNPMQYLIVSLTSCHQETAALVAKEKGIEEVFKPCNHLEIPKDF